MASLHEFKELDALVFAVGHKQYLEMGQKKILSFVRDGGIVADVKSALDPGKIDRGIRYWSL
jgi:UDP-N-acetyl-D-galactosamine dehydrogenase